MVNIDKYWSVDEEIAKLIEIEKTQSAIQEGNSAILTAIVEQLSEATGQPIAKTQETSLFNQSAYIATPLIYHDIEGDHYYVCRDVWFYNNSYTCTVATTWTNDEDIVATMSTPDFLKNVLGITRDYDLLQISRLYIKGTPFVVFNSQEMRLYYGSCNGMTDRNSFYAFPDKVNYELKDKKYYYRSNDNIRLSISNCLIGDIYEYVFEVKLFKEITKEIARQLLEKTF